MTKKNRLLNELKERAERAEAMEKRLLAREEGIRAKLGKLEYEARIFQVKHAKQLSRMASEHNRVVQQWIDIFLYNRIPSGELIAKTESYMRGLSSGTEPSLVNTLAKLS